MDTQPQPQKLTIWNNSKSTFTQDLFSGYSLPLLESAAMKSRQGGGAERAGEGTQQRATGWTQTRAAVIQLMGMWVHAHLPLYHTSISAHPSYPSNFHTGNNDGFDSGYQSMCQNNLSSKSTYTRFVSGTPSTLLWKLWMLIIHHWCNLSTKEWTRANVAL